MKFVVVAIILAMAESKLVQLNFENNSYVAIVCTV